MPEEFLVVADGGENQWVNDFQSALQGFGTVRIVSESEAETAGFRQEVIIIDGSLQRSLDLVERAHASNPAAEIFVATLTPEWSFAREALRKGASQIVDKTLSKEEIVRTIISPTLLLADNAKPFRNTLARFFRRAGYEVVTSGSPEEAKEALKTKDNIDLAILDIRLNDDKDESDLSGLDVAREKSCPVPVIFLTNFPAANLVTQAMGRMRGKEPLAEEFLEKREPPEMLLAATRRLLAASRERRRSYMGPLQGASRSIEGVVKNVLESELNRIVRGPVLDNYEGYVCARVASDEIVVWLQPDRPVTGEVVADAVHIRDGEDSPEAVFDFALESEDLRCRRHRAAVSVRPGQPSAELRFPYEAPDAPQPAEAWVQVLQKNRLIQVLPVRFEAPVKGAAQP